MLSGNLLGNIENAFLTVSNEFAGLVDRKLSRFNFQNQNGARRRHDDIVKLALNATDLAHRLVV